MSCASFLGILSDWHFIATIYLISLFGSLICFIYVCTLDLFALLFILLSVSSHPDSLKKIILEVVLPLIGIILNFAAWLIRDQLRKVSYQTCYNAGEKRDATYFCKYFADVMDPSEFEKQNQMKFIASWNLRKHSIILS